MTGSSGIRMKLKIADENMTRYWRISTIGLQLVQPRNVIS